MLKKGILSLGLALTLILPQAFANEGDTEAAETTAQESVVLYVDINNDGAEKLADLLDGIGTSRAEAIVAYREEHGPFIAPEDLLNVSGIGPATLEKNRQKIRIGMTDQ